MESRDLDLLKQLCSVHAPPGDERKLRDVILAYTERNQDKWNTRPEIYTDDALMDCVVLAFGQPRTAVFAHMDSVAFHVRSVNQLIRAGSPRPIDGAYLTGEDSQGAITCRLNAPDADNLSYSFNRTIDPGTSLTFQPDFRTSEDYIQCCSLDDRAGVFTALKLAETMTDGLLVFSCWEETGGGSVAFLARYIYEQFNIRQALISDVTWVTDAIEHGNGVVISRRDSGIPRQSYINRIVQHIQRAGIPFQTEVEDAGGSDGNVIHKSPYPIDWCFIGPPETHVHSPDEKIHKSDLYNTVEAYKVLMEAL